MNQSLPKINVYLAGDSTVQTYDKSNAPQAGWGQFISDYFTEDVCFHNHSMGGRSTKTFVQEGRLDEILKQIQPDDWLLIQMGHNDANRQKPERYAEPYTEFQDYLKLYIDGARKKGAHPVLITPVARLNYKNGEYINDFPDYCKSMKKLGETQKVPVIDLMEVALAHFKEVGYNAALKYFMVSVNGTDYTHFTEAGAKKIAELLADAIQAKSILLSRYAKNSNDRENPNER